MRTKASAHTVEQDAFPTCIANPLPRVYATAIGQIYVAGRCTITIKLPTYRKAAEQGGKIGCYSLLLIGIATVTGYVQEPVENTSRRRELFQKHSSPDAGAIAQRRRTDELA